MLYDTPKAPSYKILTHGASPLTHKTNGFGQTNPKKFSLTGNFQNSFMSRPDPNHGLSGYGWTAAVHRARRRGMSDVYVNDNPGLGGFFDNLISSVKGTVTDAFGKSVEVAGQAGVTKLTQTLTKPSNPQPQSVSAPSTPSVFYASSSPESTGEIFGIPAKYYGYAALALVGTTIYAKLKK